MPKQLVELFWSELEQRDPVSLREPGISARDKVAYNFLNLLDLTESSEELQDEEMLSGVFDWATDSLARTASMTQETVGHRRALLREMAVRERQIDQELARTARNLERLTAG